MQPHKGSGPGGGYRIRSTTPRPTTSAYIVALTPDIERQIRLRIAQDVVLEASADYWQHRARTFANVGTPACDQIAQACRAKARLIRARVIEP